MSKQQKKMKPGEKKIHDPDKMKPEIRKLKDYYAGIVLENDAMKREIESSKRIIWALLEMSPGKEISVPDRIMMMANDDSNQIESYYDGSKGATVLRSKTNQSRIIQ